MFLLKVFLKLYLLNVLAVFLHEMFHYIVAKMYWNNVDKIVIGNDRFALHFGKFVISPFVTGGRIDINMDNYVAEKQHKKIVIFYTAGVIANILLIAFSFGVLKGIYGIFYVVYNFIIIIFNVIPVGENDIVSMIHVLRNK